MTEPIQDDGGVVREGGDVCGICRSEPNYCPTRTVIGFKSVSQSVSQSADHADHAVSFEGKVP